ncbi:MAG: RNA polymerase sigma factor [Opitutales bacterium]
MDEHENASYLCRAAQAGDRAAASKLLRPYHEKIYVYFRRLCGSDSDAEDLTQWAFCKAWTSLPRFRNDSSFSTWLYQISYRIFLDWLRRPDREARQSDVWWERVPADAPSPFETAAKHEMAASVHRIVNTLDQDLQQAVHLHYYQGLSVTEVGEVTGVSVSTLKYRLRSARDRIRAELQQERAELKEVDYE